GVLADEQRVVGFAEEAGVLAGRHGAVGDDVGVGDEGGDAGAGGGQAIDNGAVGGTQVGRVAQPLVVGRRRVAGEAVVAGRVVVFHFVAQAAEDRHLVHHSRHSRQPFADVEARNPGGDRLEFAADAVGGVGLHVEGVVVTRP